MYPYILCFCGRPLGHIYDAFVLMRAYKYTVLMKSIGYDMDVNAFSISDDIKLDLTDVFKALQIESGCCRARLNTQVEFKTVY